jgi:hypothetical protein
MQSLGALALEMPLSAFNTIKLILTHF